MNLGYVFLAAELFVVLSVAAAVVIRKVWPPIVCAACGGEACRCEPDDRPELDQAVDVEIDGGRPINELDYALRMGGEQ
ncbi:hypothetical protein [Nocardia cyriacigeorgica]|uniref:hypothetical protein n=1 Tax=Nocardia cyriacigeorgica TaxID=135487 RepID=UPI0013CFBD24|nr:hypothetical protein [Nocardia cyriacigeorgica]NEW27280.1 hypothetical protein [Nocardia cyriacigeorgica]